MRAKTLGVLFAVAAGSVIGSAEAGAAASADSHDTWDPSISVAGEAVEKYSEPTYVTLDEQTYGPTEGVSVIADEVDLSPAPDSGYGANAYWGSSYAYSTHPSWAHYVGWAKAAANVYGGERIIGACFTHSRGGTYVVDWTCSNAQHLTNGWAAGHEVSKLVLDSPDPNAPTTKFHMRTTRIDPDIW